ncbi:MAG: hypothetical protein ABIR33_09535 [Pyrinomonadaceae bacterium]
MRVVIELNARIHDKRERARVLGRVPGEAAKRHKVRTRRKMIDGPHTGNLYDRKGGAGFSRSHQASARGQRPSPDTFTLVNAVTDERTGEMSARVFIAEKINPRNGANASEYAEILQFHLGRPIMTGGDAIDGDRIQNKLAEKAIQELL